MHMRQMCKTTDSRAGKSRRHGQILIPVLAAVLLVSLPAAACLGARTYSFGEVIRALFDPSADPMIFMLRIPRVLLGALAGASLAVCGVAMQALVRNELADPFILGVSSGASAFASLDMLFGVFAFFGTYRLSFSAFLGATLTILIVFSLGVRRGRIQIPTLLLSGVAVSMMMDGLTEMITLMAPNALGLHNATFWMSGSLASARWEYLGLPAAVLAFCLIVLGMNHRKLDALSLGESQATTLGVNVRQMQMLLILVASLLAGVTVSLCGTIGFVGLMAPHFARMLTGSKHKPVLWVSALCGALLVVWTDVLARILFAPEELPIGVLTAMLGGPVFIYMIRRKRGKRLD